MRGGAPDMEAQIVAEARGVTRKNVPWAKFCSTYCDFSVKAQQKLTVQSVKHIGVGEGGWNEAQFFGRLRQSLSNKVHSRYAFIHLSVLC